MINLNDVTKRYGHTVSIDNLSLDLSQNKILCLLGRNGAGKTTLMKLIAGHINASSGVVAVTGAPVGTAHIPEEVSFIENRAVQFNTTIEKLIGMAYRLDRNFDEEFAQSMIQKLRLNKRKKYAQLSFGMQTMVTTLLSLSSKRPIVLLDESVLGLDAIMRSRFYDLLNDSFESNPRLIIVSTHLIDEIAQSAQDLLILEKGKILFQSAITDIDEFAYSVTGSTDAVNKVLTGSNVIAQRSFGGHTTAYVYDKTADAPSGLTVQPVGLQDFFINMVGGYSDED